eukprot:CAMPEP_0203841924 /NCGR_PEP_ID=MMETSP0359-20131031/1685_1 /ASSEMBLY_ACC=CAM_ASM_000338 /TAXON_ID=268821 /ORGANISM="Scrippsiella Hangoei, Strain SHTV-5" /LENGTH=48 /DNA_ID= /DNA_START= /DNA_END= /DNA_ORIENTATION=
MPAHAMRTELKRIRRAAFNLCQVRSSEAGKCADEARSANCSTHLPFGL